jgi:hypothetical protein
MGEARCAGAVAGLIGLRMINEVFDAEEPFRPEGCVALARSVAEILRCWGKTSE